MGEAKRKRLAGTYPKGQPMAMLQAFAGTRGDEMITEEMLSKLKAWNAEYIELVEKYGAAPEGEMEALEHRIRELLDKISRVMGLSEADIAEIDAEAEAEVKAQIEHEVETGLALYKGALRGDQAAIAKLRKGSIEFASAIGEGAIPAEDLAKLPLAVEFASAASKARSSTKH
jgi:hypothetical protein